MIGRIISIAVVLLILAGAAWALWPRPVGVDTALVGRGDLKVSVEEEGLARIREVFRVSAPVAGRLTRVAVHAGDKVALGQSVATIEPAGPGLLDERTRRIAEAAVQAAEAAVTLAEAGLSQAEAENAYAQTELERKVALADRGLVSSQIEQQATLAAATAQKSVDVATATLAMRRQDLEGARAALIEGSGGPSSTEACCVTVASPIDGQVLNVLNESELVVQPGTPLMDLGDPTNLEIVVDVLSTDAVRIVPHASATIESWGGEPLRAEVERINPTAITKVSALGIEEQRTEVVLHLLDPPQKWARLGHGFRVVAHIVVWEGTDSLLVPVGALFRRGEDWTVFVVEAGTAKLRTISIGERSDAYAEVTAGLEEAEVVVVHPADTVSDGTSVALLSTSAE